MKTLRQQRRDNNLQRMQARGNTIIAPTYREVYGGRGDVVAQVYLGHRATFGKRMLSPLLDSVSRLSFGARVPDALAAQIVDAVRLGRKQAGVPRVTAAA